MLPLPLPLSNLQSSWPAIVPYKAPGVFTPCPTPLPSSGAFLGQADVTSLIACGPYGVALAVLVSPWQSYNPFAARLMDLLRSLCGLGSSPWQDRRRSSSLSSKRKVTYKR